jgi:hypothetical protein
MYIAETGAMAVATLMIGTFGAVALAGNQVAMSVGGLLYMVPLGIAGAVAIRVAQERGAGNLDALRPITWAALGMGRSGWPGPQRCWACMARRSPAGSPMSPRSSPSPPRSSSSSPSAR